MLWNHYVSYFFGGLILANALPHLAAGTMGKPFQSPFARPPGKGYSSSTINAVWGWVNLVIAYLLLVQVGTFDIRSPQCAVTLLLGTLCGALMGAVNFGKLNGGNRPLEAQAANSLIPKGA